MNDIYLSELINEKQSLLWRLRKEQLDDISRENIQNRIKNISDLIKDFI